MRHITTRAAHFALSALLLLPVACDGEDNGADAGPGIVRDSGFGTGAVDVGFTDSGASDAGQPPLEVVLTHSTTAAYAGGGGAVAALDDSVLVVADDLGLTPVDATGRRGALPQGKLTWTLTSTGFGAAASHLAVPPMGAVSGDRPLYFVGTGTGQIGALEVGADGVPGALLGEALLGAPLGPFPSALEAPATGPASDSLWAVDAPFGPGGAVVRFPYADFNAGAPVASMTGGFTVSAVDANGDATDDVPVLGALAFSPDGSVGLVAHSFLAPGVAGAAGGVVAFDVASGAELGRVVLPLVDSSTTTSGFAGGIAASEDRLLIVHAEKDPMFADLGGYLSVYTIESWRPFVVTDADAASFDQPSRLETTSVANAVAVTVVGRSALVLAAPFFAPGAVDVFDLDGAGIHSSLPIGQPYATGFNVPQRPVITPAGDAAFVATEVGLVRMELRR